MASYFNLDHKLHINPIAQLPVASASVKSSGSGTSCRMTLIIWITRIAHSRPGLIAILTIGANIANHIQSMPSEIELCNGVEIGKRLPAQLQRGTRQFQLIRYLQASIS
ncbi:hypothetical protein JWZ98_00060 [Methylomonas sp. EFPC1]|uniref:hypothetical protein n=1 Tax=Methylomonas sp. EFPC1 TaxID=2812647 RepID=UPI001968315B|nr:hypothetical protein [Methylomonas sp. EFPC1]QSB01409.1 hypothetical protein JWZ98_00060 [Methylomonas sp. EFPC1]